MAQLPVPIPPSVMLVPVVGAPSTAPPASPWYLGLKRAGILLVPFLPAVINVLINLVQTGQVQVPAAWVPVVTTLIVVVQAIMKQQKEAERQNASDVLRATGIPTGQTFSAATMATVLNTPATLKQPAPIG